MGLGNLTMLFGLGAVAIPLVIHLLHRRRYDVVDWGAMQFLQVSETTRRRLALEQILLLLLRMGLVALLVLALAAPYGSGRIFARLGHRPNRDVVLIIDGSYSMGYDDGSGKTPSLAAREWARAFLDDLVPGDSVALLLAQRAPVPVIAEPAHDLDRVREALFRLLSPKGTSDWPRALEEAERILATASKRPDRDIILLGDLRRQGWADLQTLFHWERLGAGLKSAGRQDQATPRIWAVDVATDREQETSYPNYAVAPLQAARTVAWSGQPLTFKSALIVSGLEAYEPPKRLRLEVDGETVRDLPAPAATKLTNGQIPLTFTHRFSKPGLHRVALVVEPDLPIEQRPEGYRLRDCLPGDNRQELAIEVVESLPVLLVYGSGPAPAAEASTYFLKNALALSTEPNRPAVIEPRVVSSQAFAPEILAEGKARVLVLADVSSLTVPQEKAVARFLEQGGGVLVVLGPRVDADAYNEDLLQEGRGWLPARLEKPVGDPAQPEQAAHPDTRRLQHPALEVFNDSGTLAQARFPRWWKIAAAEGKTTVAAFLTSNDPLLVEKNYKAGRVLLCTVPLDRSWGSNFPSVWEYPVLVHELIYYLAGAPSAGKAPATDLRESDLTPASEEERSKVAGLVPLKYVEGGRAPFDILAETTPRQELWWLLMAVVIVLLCCEIWLTRRMVRD